MSWDSYLVCTTKVCKSILSIGPDYLRMYIPAGLVDFSRGILSFYKVYEKTLPMITNEEAHLEHQIRMIDTLLARLSTHKVDATCWHAYQNAQTVRARAYDVLKSIKTRGKLFEIDEETKEVKYDSNTVMRLFKPEVYLVLIRAYIAQTTGALLLLQNTQLRIDVAESIADENHRNNRKSILAQQCSGERQEFIASSKTTSMNVGQTSRKTTATRISKPPLRRSSRIAKRRRG